MRAYFLAQPRGSLRQWLLGASLLAVLAGYGLLLIANGWLADRERRAEHQQRASLLQQELLRTLPAADGASGLAKRLPSLASPALLVWLPAAVPHRVAAHSGVPTSFVVPQGRELHALLEQVHRSEPQPRGVQSLRLGRRHYLTSALPLSLGGRLARLRFLEDVTLQSDQQRRNALLLSVFAGTSTLFTAALLRPVLDSGLRPLQELGERMELIQADSLDREPLDPAGQPRELAPIARSFNDLLHRLAASWEQERSFANGVSHELRTPITLIGGYASRLRRRGNNLGAEEREQLALIEAEVARMGRLVSDLLDIARQDASRLETRRQPFDLVAATERVAGRMDPAAGGRLRLAALPPGPLLVLGDVDRFEQCLTNLIENALKYAPAPTPVELAVVRAGAGGRVQVIDRGPGVSDQDKQRIFERFVRGSATGAVPGSGIGLAVVRSLMGAMGGSVAVSDAPGGGADFRLILPAATDLPSGAGEPARSPSLLSS